MITRRTLFKGAAAAAVATPAVAEAVQKYTHAEHKATTTITPKHDGFAEMVSQHHKLMRRLEDRRTYKAYSGYETLTVLSE